MVEAKIIEQIKSILPNIAIYHDFAIEEANVPFVVLARVGGAGKLFLDRETVGGYEIRLQVSVWAGNRIHAIELSRQIEQALFGLPECAALGASVASFDVQKNWRGMRQDFMLIGD